MQEATRQLFWKIINCGSVEEGHCAECLQQVKIVQQGVLQFASDKGRCLEELGRVKRELNKGICNDPQVGDAEFQIPEPWNGDIENAKLLFVGINPGLDTEERFPCKQDGEWYDGEVGQWRHQAVEDFFENRFLDSREYTKASGNSFRVNLKNGQYGRAVKYWGFLVSCMKKCLNSDAEFGRDCVLTESIFCKTPRQCFLPKLPLRCERFDRSFGEMLTVGKKLETLIIVGEVPRRAVVRFFLGKNRKVDTYTWYGVSYRNKRYNLMFTDHSSGRGERQGSAEKIPLLVSDGVQNLN